MKRWRWYLVMLLLCMICFIPTNTVRAANNSGKAGKNITWKLAKDGTLTLNGTGAMYNYNSDEGNPAPWCNRDDIIVRKIVISDGITTIGDEAFQMTGISSIKIPNSVTSIGKLAFYFCMLDNITWGSSVNKIGERAFLDCWSLNNVKIPDSVTSIGKGAFSRCYGLESITLSNKLKVVAESLFADCEALKTITIPTSVTQIKEYAFGNCSSLKTVKLNANLKSIGKYAFLRCSKLSSITIPEKVEKLYTLCFGSCTDLQKVTFKSKAASINKDCFDIDDGKNIYKNANLVIYGYKDSTAQTYANKYKIGFQTIGENLAGKVSITNSSSSNKQISLKWKKVTNAFKYEIQVCNKSSFANAYVQVLTTKTSADISDAAKIKSGKTYYVRVRAYTKKNGKQILGAWSEKVKIKING